MRDFLSSVPTWQNVSRRTLSAINLRYEQEMAAIKPSQVADQTGAGDQPDCGLERGRDQHQPGQHWGEIAILISLDNMHWGEIVIHIRFYNIGVRIPADCQTGFLRNFFRIEECSSRSCNQQNFPVSSLISYWCRLLDHLSEHMVKKESTNHIRCPLSPPCQGWHNYQYYIHNCSWCCNFNWIWKKNKKQLTYFWAFDCFQIISIQTNKERLNF